MRIPSTRFNHLVFILSLFVAWNFQSQTASAQDPADVYLTGYMMVRDAEEYYAARDYEKAYQKYVEAGKFFTTIAQRWPNFETSMVDFRRKKINEAISKIERIEGFNPVKGYGRRPQAERSGAGSVGRPRESAADQMLRQKDEQIRDLTNQRAQLGRQLAEKDRELRQALTGKVVAEKKVGSLMNQIGVLNEELTKAHNAGAGDVSDLKDKVAKLENDLALSKKSVADADERAEQLKQELDKASNYGQSLIAEKEELAKERERVKKLLSGSGDEQIQLLIAENDRLRKNLDDARAEASKLRKENSENKDLIAKLRSKITTVEEELAKMQEQNATYRKQVAELTDQLKRTDAQLDAMAKSKGGANPILVKENKVLRDIIGKQLKSQARRKQAKQRVVAELAKLEIGSKEVLDMIENMGGDAPLTAEEIQIFKHSFEFDEATLISSGANAGEAPSYPEINNNDGPKGSIGLNQDLTQFAKAAAYDFFRGNFNRCEASYEQILQIVPDNVHSLRNLGVVKIRLKKWDEAKQVLEKALAYEPENHYSHYVLGVLHYRLRQPDAAIAAMEESLRLNPKNPRAHFYIAAICMEHRGGSHGRRDPERAVSELKKTLQLDPKYGDAHFNLAILYIEAPQPQLLQARQHYRQALRLGSQGTPDMERRLGT